MTTTLTDAQFEIAARHYCAFMNENPDEALPHHAIRNPDGSPHFTLRWKLIAESLRTQHAANEALRFAQNGGAS